MSQLNGIRVRFLILILVGLLIAPLAGLSAALLYGLVSVSELLAPRTLLLMGLFIGGFTTLAGIYFYNNFRYLSDNGLTAGEHLPDHQQRRLARFGRDYWTCFLVYALAIPPLFFVALGQPFMAAPGRLLQLLLLQLSVVVLVGLPTYQLALDQIGKLAGQLSLQRIHTSLKSRVMLLGGFVPLLCYTVLMNYHWLQTGQLTGGHMAIWFTLVCITGLITLFTVRSLAQALQPIHELITRSGASRHGEIAQLQPRSTDEIGYFTQMLGKLSRQLNEQEAQMHAVVETAAEGIIVIDTYGTIDTFNTAAEKLFGYTAGEIKQYSLRTLIPLLFDEQERLIPTSHKREVEGIRHDGQRIQLVVRMSTLQVGSRLLYTCLVADISERKAMEKRLREAETRYRDLVESAHDMVWTLDTDGRYTYVNPACSEIYAYSQDEMRGHYLYEFRSPDHPPRDQQAIGQLLRGKDTVEFETVHLDGEGRPHFLEFSARAHKDPAGFVLRISGTTRDVTEQKAFQHQLSYNAEHDPMTGMFNRNYFQEELERTVARVVRSGATCALFFIDLDQFKYINDTLGHAAGDRLLLDISALLSTHVRDGDLIARFGGDEFTLLLYNIERSDVIRAAENFRMLCDNFTFTEHDKSWNVSVSIGIAMIDRHTHSADEVLSHADLACNMAKSQGRNRINLYDPEDLDKADMAADMGWATQVRAMLEHDRFKLVYQPIVDTVGGEVLDYEVLVRMVCDDGQIILPGGFMPAAERFGLIHSVDRWIVRHAIEQLQTLHLQGQQASFSINLSGKAFEDDSLLPLIRDLLDSSGMEPSYVTFEITETAAIANLAAAEEFITALKDIGCQFALDDFGSGFSSFAYLKHLPVDKLKIDGGFVKGMAHSSVDQAMVESMNQVAHALGKVTVAECVENEETLEILREMCVDRAQGNYIGHPDSLPGPLAPHTDPTDRVSMTQ